MSSVQPPTLSSLLPGTKSLFCPPITTHLGRIVKQSEAVLHQEQVGECGVYKVLGHTAVLHRGDYALRHHGPAVNVLHTDEAKR
jgi:hypothetical protein